MAQMGSMRDRQASSNLDPGEGFLASVTYRMVGGGLVYRGLIGLTILLILQPLPNLSLLTRLQNLKEVIKDELEVKEQGIKKEGQLKEELRIGGRFEPGRRSGGRYRVRLVGGTAPHLGNLQIGIDDVWGYVCDDGFGFVEADVACRTLGYSHAITFTRNNHFGPKTREWRRSKVNIWFDNLNCDVVEKDPTATLQNCSSNGIGVHDCIPTELAGVVCAVSPNISPCTRFEYLCPGSSSVCIPRQKVCDGLPHCRGATDEEEELCQDLGVTRVTTTVELNIPGSTLGIVELKRNEEWGSVCDQRFTERDAQVVCRSLGYEGGWSVAFYKSYLGEGKGPVWMVGPQCTGLESWLGQCANATWGQAYCSHQQDVSVFCHDQGVSVRTIGGQSQGTGRVELRLGNQWGSLCTILYDHLDAQVLCRHMGYEGDAEVIYGAGVGEGPMWQLILDCSGSERHIQQCRVRLLASPCNPASSAGVICTRRRGEVDKALSQVLPQDCGEPEDASSQFLLTLAKIRGGLVPTRFDTPWLTSIRSSLDNRMLSCGGVIITDDLVLTAAHCTALSPLSIVVRVGDHNSQVFEHSEEDFFVDKIFRHELFDGGTLDNDIAILKLRRKADRGIRFGDRVRPVCLPKSTDSYNNLRSCSVSGWGPLRVDRFPEATLQEASTSVLADRYCESTPAYGGSDEYTSSMVCVGVVGEPINPCRGDSGGPLACTVRGRRTVFGVVSFGLPCASQTAPDVFTRITKFLPWILDKIILSRTET